MSKHLLKTAIEQGVRDNLNTFFLDVSNDYSEIEDNLSIYDDDRFASFQTTGEIVFNPNEKLVVVTAEVAEDLTERSGKKAQYEKTKKILKDYMKYDAGFFIFSDPTGSFRFSLVYGQAEGIRKSWSNFRRFTYFVSRDQTNKTFLDRVGGCDFSSLDVIKDAFSVEKVNKEFYKEIAKYYYRLTGKNGYERELVLPSVGEGDDKKYEEYAVRLIGRIIFCWFLKHKKSASGIPLIPDEVLSVSAVQNYTNYFHSVLEPLFFEVMNQRVKDRKPINVPQSDRIPFLNGGLFEPHPNDYYQGMPNYALKIPDRWFEDFLSVLERYNFTIDENSIVDADVSVDPEMLGRIFENLLAEVVPETGETARKATGSYYTPRVIVDYMVEQSLKQYLLAKTALPEDKVNQLLSYEDNSADLTGVERNATVKALKEIKVIDPACGSGAFPMGILHRMLLVLEKVDPRLELWRAKYLESLDSIVRQTVEKNISRENWAYIRKLIIIRDSIYGVDIQPIAVEIAKLRCFLSLVVDEIVLDSEENRGVEPLPNLEFKFVAANTLIGLPKITDLGIMENRGLINDLAGLRREYFTSNSRKKEQVKCKFTEVQGKLRDHYEKFLITRKTDFTGITKKIEATDTTQTQMLAEWFPFSYESFGWFDPEWMFGISGRFDVVIENPPWVVLRHAEIGEDLVRRYKKEYSAATGFKLNLFPLFTELSLNLLKEKGVMALIVPNRLLDTPSYRGIRERLVNETEILDIENLPSGGFDDVVAGNIILISKKMPNKLKQLVVRNFYTNEILTIPFNEIKRNANLTININTQPQALPVITKIKHCSVVPLSHICNIHVGMMIRNKSRVLQSSPKYKTKIVTSKDLTRYSIIQRKYFDMNTIDVFGGTKDTTKHLEAPKLLVRKTGNVILCTLDDEGTFAEQSVYLVLLRDNRYDIRFLNGLLNSTLITFYFQNELITNPESYPYIQHYDLENIPIIDVNNDTQKPFVAIVDQIITIIKDADYLSNSAKQARVKELEYQIDQMVYKLYGLTPEEIEIVEGPVNERESKSLQ